MTAQEILNTVLTRMMAQGKAAESHSGCVYRTSDGRACAVGCLLDDETAKFFDKREDHFDTSITTLESRVGDRFPEELRPHVALLQELQNVHDKASWGDFKEEFFHGAATVAEEYGLSMPEGVSP